MRARYTYLGDSTIEVVIDGEEVAVNILPAEKNPVISAPAVEITGQPVPAECSQDMPPEAAASQPTQDVVEPPPAPSQPAQDAPIPLSEDGVVSCAAPAPPSGKRRTLMGTIRAGWFVAFTVAGEALTYALNNLTSFNLPPGTATAIGAVGYGLKRGIWPDTTV